MYSDFIITLAELVNINCYSPNSATFGYECLKNALHERYSFHINHYILQ